MAIDGRIVHNFAFSDMRCTNEHQLAKPGEFLLDRNRCVKVCANKHLHFVERLRSNIFRSNLTSLGHKLPSNELVDAIQQARLPVLVSCPFHDTKHLISSQTSTGSLLECFA